MRGGRGRGWSEGENEGEGEGGGERPRLRVELSNRGEARVPFGGQFRSKRSNVYGEPPAPPNTREQAQAAHVCDAAREPVAACEQPHLSPRDACLAGRDQIGEAA